MPGAPKDEMDEVLMIPGVPGSSGRGVGGATSDRFADSLLIQISHILLLLHSFRFVV